MIQGKTIICLSTIDWHYVKQRHQILMEKFAENGNQVIFVEHLGFSRQKLTDIANILKRVLRAIKLSNAAKGSDSLIPNLQIITPLILPPQNRLFNFINKYMILDFLSRKLLKLCDNEPIVWTYLATTTAVNLIKKLAPKTLIYDCVYDALRHPEAPCDIAATEHEILSAADVVITDAKYFYKKKRNFNKNIHQIPPGVDFDHFNKIDAADKKIMKDVVRPRICFFGCMSKEKLRINLDLLEFIARKRPEWSIVNIGPLVGMGIPPNLLRLGNIIWLGFIAYSELPKYLAQCDALILPYKLNDFTESVLPAKVFECLATGKPVVSTALPELEPYKEYFIIAKSKEEFLSGLEDAINNDTQEKQHQRIVFARSNTWEDRFKSICEIMKYEI